MSRIFDLALRLGWDAGSLPEPSVAPAARVPSNESSTSSLSGPTKPPAAPHYFGTDQIGRDTLSRVIYGARISPLVAVIVLVIA